MSRRSVGAGLALGLSLLSGNAALLRPDSTVRMSPGAGEYVQAAQAEPKPDLTVGLKASTPTAPRQDVSLTTMVRNVGAGSAPPLTCDVVIRNARPPRQELRRYQETIPALDPGDTFTFTITVKPGLGAYEVCAIVDPKNLVIEADETNNRSCETITGK